MKKKININRPEISSQEIAQRKNFDAVLKNNAMHAAPKTLLQKPWFLSGVVVATIAIVTTAVLLTQHPKTTAPAAAADSTSASDQKALDAFYKTEEAKPCIAPPIKGLNVPYTVFKVDAQKGGQLDFKTGSQLTVPKNAFTDANGNPVKGEVELRYREFHDAADFFVSGIPMTYDSAGLKYQFESAGMMEMLAYQNGKPVNMAPGKSIDVAMASGNSDPKFNLYKLDTVKNNWSCLGKDKVVAKAEKPAPSNTPAPIATVEKTPEYQKIETQKTEAKTVKETQVAALPAPAPEPKKPEKAAQGKYTFNIDVDPKEYPELAVYKGLLFEVGPENKDFSSSMYNVTWDAATIKEGSKKGQNYRLTLEKGTRKYELLVYPVFEGKDYETALKDFQDTFGKYTVTLNKRIADEKKIETEYLAKIEAYKKQQEALEREWKKKDGQPAGSHDHAGKSNARVFTEQLWCIQLRLPKPVSERRFLHGKAYQ